MNSTPQAILLVAGEGKRLRPLTDFEPKCFAKVGGVRIFDNALRALSEHGCKRVTVVVGHKAELIKRHVAANNHGMLIDCVDNADFQSTNSMYSLRLGLRGATGPTWVIEGDIFFEPQLLATQSQGDIGWFVDSTVRDLDGAYVKADGGGRVTGLAVVRNLAELEPAQSKSVGILRLSARGSEYLAKWLDEGIAARRKNDYYDLILGDQVPHDGMRSVDVAGRRWFEIDTMQDLARAEALFAPRNGSRS